MLWNAIKQKEQLTLRNCFLQSLTIKSGKHHTVGKNNNYNVQVNEDVSKARTQHPGDCGLFYEMSVEVYLKLLNLSFAEQFMPMAT